MFGVTPKYVMAVNSEEEWTAVGKWLLALKKGWPGVAQRCSDIAIARFCNSATAYVNFEMIRTSFHAWASGRRRTLGDGGQFTSFRQTGSCVFTISQPVSYNGKSGIVSYRAVVQCKNNKVIMSIRGPITGLFGKEQDMHLSYSRNNYSYQIGL